MSPPAEQCSVLASSHTSWGLLQEILHFKSTGMFTATALKQPIIIAVQL